MWPIANFLCLDVTTVTTYSILTIPYAWGLFLVIMTTWDQGRLSRAKFSDSAPPWDALNDTDMKSKLFNPKNKQLGRKSSNYPENLSNIARSGTYSLEGV